MARNDGIDRTVARNQDLETPADVAKVQEHNEREKDSYSNQDIVPERTSLNIHFKAPTDDSDELPVNLRAVAPAVRYNRRYGFLRFAVRR